MAADRNVDTTRTTGNTNETGIRTRAWANVALGVIVILVAFFTAVTDAPFWNNVIVGLLVAILAGYVAWAVTNARTENVTWAAGANVILGLWLIAYPFFNSVPTTYQWANVIAGLLIALIAGYNAYDASRTPTTTRGGRTV